MKTFIHHYFGVSHTINPVRLAFELSLRRT